MENNFETNTSPEFIEKENREPILNEDDQKVLEFGLHGLEDLLKTKEAAELPSTIILMDISARVLYYAIKPIIESVYRNKQQEMPQFYFLSAIRDDEIIKLNTYQDEKGEKKVKENIDYDGWKTAFRNRFIKILDNTSAGNILIVDDYLSKGETLNKIQTTASEILPADRQLDFFAFFDNNNNRTIQNTSINIHSGINRNELRSKGLVHFNALSFTNKYNSPWMPQTESKHKKEEIVGVRKTIEPQETVTPNEKVDLEGKKHLRKEMAAIAKKVLADKDFDKKKEINNLPPDISYFM